MNSIKRLVEEYLNEEENIQFKDNEGTTVTIKKDGNGYYWDDGQRNDPARWEDPKQAEKSYFDQKQVDNSSPVSENKLSDKLLNQFYKLDKFIANNNIDLNVPYNQMRADPQIDVLASQVGMDSVEFLDQYLSYKGK